MLKALTILIITTSLLATEDAAIPVIDLTNVISRHRLREPATTSASGGMVGYEGGARPAAPLTVELVSLRRHRDDDTLLIAEVEVRNVSKIDVAMPVDPSSRDLEPTSPATPYHYLKAYIWLAAEAGGGGSMPSTGLFLYGARAIPSSIRTLTPGQAVRIRAKIPLSPSLESTGIASTNPATAVRAFLGLFAESITPQRGSLHSATEELFPTISSSKTVEFPRPD